MKNKYNILLLLNLALTCFTTKADVPAVISTAQITFSVPTQGGGIESSFSIGEGKYVRFSQGNLQFCAGMGWHACADGTTKAGTWRFAEHQYDRVGGASCGEVMVYGVSSDNIQRSSSYMGWIDLFHFASGGFSIQPWSTSNYVSKWDITGTNANHDWGVYNAISNGGNMPNQWRTLTDSEWRYLLLERSNSAVKSGIASVNGIHGMVLLPDNWILPTDCSFVPNATSFDTNSYDTGLWSSMETAGAVFLPCAGELTDTVFYCDYINNAGMYWKANTPTGHSHVFAFSQSGGSFNTMTKDNGCYSVRLVQDVASPIMPPIIDDTCALTLSTQVDSVYGGTIAWQAEGCNYILTAQPKTGYTFYQWENWNNNPKRIVTHKPSYFYASFARAHSVRFVVDENKPSPFAPIIGWVRDEPIPNVPSGYCYLGWSTTKGSSFPDVTFPYFPTKDITLYAVMTTCAQIVMWKNNSIIIRYTGNASAVETQTTNGTKLFSYLSSCKKGTYIYEIPISDGDLLRDVGNKLILRFVDNDRKLTYELSSTTIPYILSRSCRLSDIYTERMNYVVPRHTTLTISQGNYVVGDLTIYGGGKVVIDENASVHAREMMMRGGDISQRKYQFVYPEIVVNGYLNVDNDSIFYDCLLNSTQQYALALPEHVKLSEISFAMSHEKIRMGNDLRIAYYDGAKRATGVSGWNYIPDTQVMLNAGTGYTAIANPQSFRQGNTGTNQKMEYSLVRFPMHIGQNYSEQEKIVTVYPHPAAKDNDAGWNLVANPYFATFKRNLSGFGTNEEGIGKLVNDGHGGYIWQGTLRYVVIPSDNGKYYSSMYAANAELPAFKNVFVQIGNDDALEFALTNRVQAVASRWRNEPSDEIQETTCGIILRSLPNTMMDSTLNREDHLGILISEAYSDAYEINADLQKFGQNAGVNVCALNDKEELAYIAIDKQHANNIMLGVQVPQLGSYQFSVDSLTDKSMYSHIYLSDLLTQQSIDLLLDDYTYSARQNEEKNRFLLSIIPIQTSPLPTDEKEVYKENDSAIYDLLGRRVHPNTCKQGRIYIQNNHLIIR